MRQFWVISVFIVCFTIINFMNKGVDNLALMKDRYKNALDLATDAAAEFNSYENQSSIINVGTGFGTAEQSRKNVEVNKDEALQWFYRVFYRNLGIQNDTAQQDRLKKYIPMKALVTFDKIMIADYKDTWIVDKYYDMEINGQIYRFTLSDQVKRLSSNTWGRDIDFGISPEYRKALVSQYVRDELNTFLSNRENFESGKNYTVYIALNDIDIRNDDVDGVNFIAMAEGLPLPSFNPIKPQRYFAFSLGGSEITR